MGKHGLGCGSGSNAGKGKERKEPALCSSHIPNFSCQKLCLIDRSFSGPGPQKVHVLAIAEGVPCRVLSPSNSEDLKSKGPGLTGLYVLYMYMKCHHEILRPQPSTSSRAPTSTASTAGRAKKATAAQARWEDSIIWYNIWYIWYIFHISILRLVIYSIYSIGNVKMVWEYDDGIIWYTCIWEYEYIIWLVVWNMNGL